MEPFAPLTHAWRTGRWPAWCSACWCCALSATLIWSSTGMMYRTYWRSCCSMVCIHRKETVMSHSHRPNLGSPHFMADPYSFYARLRAEAPAFRTTLPTRQPAWLITRYADALAVLKDDRLV